MLTIQTHKVSHRSERYLDAECGKSPEESRLITTVLPARNSQVLGNSFKRHASRVMDSLRTELALNSLQHYEDDKDHPRSNA
jgi:hypothetical protein